MINYKGNFVKELYTFFKENPELTIGESLYSVLRKSNLRGEHFVYSSDETIYNSLELLNSKEKEEDEPMDEQQFGFWIEQVTVIKS